MPSARGRSAPGASANGRLLMVLESVFPSPGSGGAEAQVLTLGRYLLLGVSTGRGVTPRLRGRSPGARRQRSRDHA